MNRSPTPRTDALAAQNPDSCDLHDLARAFNKMLDSARQLERELGALPSAAPRADVLPSCMIGPSEPCEAYSELEAQFRVVAGQRDWAFKQLRASEPSAQEMLEAEHDAHMECHRKLAAQAEHLISLLNEVAEFLSDYEDVRDGSYGVPQPNAAMSLRTRVDEEINRLRALK